MKHQIFNRYEQLVREWDDESRTFHDYEADETRPYTPAENAEADQRAAEQNANDNYENLMTKAAAAIQNNRDYLAISSPTNAQNAQQVKSLTRQMTALIRIVTKQLDTTEGT